MSTSLLAPVVPSLMTVEAFLDWVHTQPGRWQLVDGEPRAMNSSSRTHGTLQTELSALLVPHLRSARPGCNLVAEAGIVPQVMAPTNYRIPDLVVTCVPYDKETWVIEQPVLIIEVLSHSNQAETWMNVWAYATIPSLQEILIVHTDALRADLLRRTGDNTWPTAPEVITGEGSVALESVGLAFVLASLFVNTRLA